MQKIHHHIRIKENISAGIREIQAEEDGNFSDIVARGMKKYLKWRKRHSKKAKSKS